MTRTLIAFAIASLAFSGAATATPSQLELPTCQQTSLTIYFAPDATDLSTSAYKALQAEATALENCNITIVEARINATDGATKQDIKALSEARQAAIEDALSEFGLNSELPWVLQATDASSFEQHPMLGRSIELTLIPADSLTIS